MLQDILNKSWKQYPTKQQLYSYLPPISKTIQIRWKRHIGQSWRNMDKLISDILLWTPEHGRASAGWTTRIYIQQLCIDTGCRLEDQPEMMDDRDEWQERESGKSMLAVQHDNDNEASLDLFARHRWVHQLVCNNKTLHIFAYIVFVCKTSSVIRYLVLIFVS